MRSLSASELLDVWERGLAEPPVERALSLWAAACPETPRAALATLSIGQRDSSLMTLREWIFGSRVASLVACPACGQQLEFTFALDEVRVRPETEGEPEVTLTVSGYEVRFRPLTSADLAAGAAGEDGRRLFERCLLSARVQGEPAPPEQLPAGVVAAVADRLTEIDPQADVRLDVQCPACGARSRPSFDIAAFFWAEIDAWARRILREVHFLASAYGWRERDILALSPWRREFYMQMVGA